MDDRAEPRQQHRQLVQHCIDKWHPRRFSDLQRRRQLGVLLEHILGWFSIRIRFVFFPFYCFVFFCFYF